MSKLKENLKGLVSNIEIGPVKVLCDTGETEPVKVLRSKREIDTLNTNKILVGPPLRIDLADGETISTVLDVDDVQKDTNTETFLNEELIIDVSQKEEFNIPLAENASKKIEEIAAECNITPEAVNGYKSTPTLERLLNVAVLILEKQNKKDVSATYEADYLMEEYTICKIGDMLGFGLGNGRWRLAFGDSQAEIVLRSLITNKYRSSQMIKEVLSEIKVQAMQKPKSFFDNPEKVLISFSDKVLDIEENELIPHSLDNRLTYSLPFTYDSTNIKTSRSLALGFIYELCGKDDDMFTRLQGALSAALLNVNLGKVFYLTGGEGGGRTVLLKMLEDAIGHENVCNLSFGDMAKNFRLPHMVGKRCVISFEQGNQILSNLDEIKKLAQGAGINTDQKYGAAFDFVNTATIFCGGQTLPNVAHGNIISIEHELEIIRLIPVCLTDRKSERNFRLKKEIEHFRAWLLEGALMLAKDDFCLRMAEGCDLSRHFEIYDDFLEHNIKEDFESKIFSKDITELFCEKTGRANNSKERTALHGRLQNNFNVEIKPIRKGDYVSSGYEGIAICNSQDEDEYVDEDEYMDSDCDIDEYDEYVRALEEAKSDKSLL